MSMGVATRFVNIEQLNCPGEVALFRIWR